QTSGFIRQQVIELGNLIIEAIQIAEKRGIGAQLADHKIIDHTANIVDVGTITHPVTLVNGRGVGYRFYSLAAVAFGIGIRNIVSHGAQRSLADFKSRDTYT